VYFYTNSHLDYFKKHGKSHAHGVHVSSAECFLGRDIAVTENVFWEGVSKIFRTYDVEVINLTTKRV
jgi:hypothetical protein